MGGEGCPGRAKAKAKAEAKAEAKAKAKGTLGRVGSDRGYIEGEIGCYIGESYSVLWVGLAPIPVEVIRIRLKHVATWVGG